MKSDVPHMELKYCYTGFATKNKKYYIGTSSATIYIYDYSSKELICKFKDVPYADKLFLNDDETILVAKSTEPKIAIYDLEELKLVHKIRVKETNQPQDANLSFSDCGKYLYNIVYDKELLSFLIKLDIMSGTYKRIDSLPHFVYTDILHIKEHSRYYLWGYERGEPNKYFIKEFDYNWNEIKHIDFNHHVTHVEYSSKDDNFYFSFLHEPQIYIYNSDFTKVVEKILIEPKVEKLKMFGLGKEVLMSKYGFTFGFSLDKQTLTLGIKYQKAVVIVDINRNILRVVPFEYGGYVQFGRVANEVFINNEAYMISE